jgi:hypothetical protein
MLGTAGLHRSVANTLIPALPSDCLSSFVHFAHVGTRWHTLLNHTLLSFSARSTWQTTLLMVLCTHLLITIV